MDKLTAQKIALENLIKEKDRLSEAIRVFQTELGEIPRGKGKAEKKGKPGRQPSAETIRTRNEMVKILQNAGKPISPADILELSNQNGSRLDEKLVRKELSRGKGKLFEQVKRGFWSVKKKE